MAERLADLDIPFTAHNPKASAVARPPYVTISTAGHQLFAARVGLTNP